MIRRWFRQTSTVTSPQVTAAAQAERSFWAWALAAVTLMFFFWWLWRAGWWSKLIVADPSGVSLGVALLTSVLTAWIGKRAWHIKQQALPDSNWRDQYRRWHQMEPDRAGQLLSELTHGPHETAWWFAGATIKLGMLGTVVGFILMSSSIGEAPNFDFDQVQGLLKKMTQGMAVALYTTLVGLVANLWLGLLLLLLDRTADRLAADVVSASAASRDGS